MTRIPAGSRSHAHLENQEIHRKNLSTSGSGGRPIAFSQYAKGSSRGRPRLRVETSDGKAADERHAEQQPGPAPAEG